MRGTWEATIAEREAELGPDTVARMAKIFLAESKSQLTKIDAALAKRDLPAARRVARDLAEHAGSLCFEHLRRAAEEFALACAADDCANLPSLGNALAPLVEITSIQLRARYRLK